MIIGGLQKFSLLDYPEHISAIVFTQGCNFRCQFCYNPMLVWPDYGKANPDKEGHSWDEDGLLAFLTERFGKLDGVVITGGEPTIHQDLDKFARKIKKIGYKVKLDTNGTNPEVLKSLIKEKLIDYIAMDVKASEVNYEKVVGVKVDMEKIKASIKIIMTSGLPYEFRTTIVPSLVDRQEVKAIGEMIKGAEKWFLQQFKPDTDLVNHDFQSIKPYPRSELAAMEKIAAQYVKFCQAR
jgi:pyruvate formate lyase activating enzyme